MGRVGAEGGLGGEGERAAWRSVSLKWAPPGRMDLAMSDLATRIRNQIMGSDPIMPIGLGDDNGV